MKLPAIISKLKLLASLDMAAQSYKALILDLAEQLEQEEARLSEDRARKIRGSSTETKKENTPTPPKENNIYIPPIAPPTSKPEPVEPEGFAEFKAVYPKRDGNNSWKEALKAWGPAVKRAGNWLTIVSAAKAYASHCSSKGKTNTEFVKQARSWLNQDLWQEWKPFKTAEELGIQQPTTRVPVNEGTPQWEAWKRAKPAVVARDIILPDGRKGWGWYFPTEYPQEQAA